MRMHLQAGPGAVSKQPSAARRLEAIRTKGAAVALGALLVALLAGARAAQANVPLTQVSSDPFTNCDEPARDRGRAGHVRRGQHRRGHLPGRPLLRRRRHRHRLRPLRRRRRDLGPPGFLPGMTSSSGAHAARSSASAIRASPTTPRTRTWLISSIPLLPNTSVPTVFVSRSTDDGRTWSTPVSIPPPASKSVDLDKNWTVCDNVAAAVLRPLLHRARQLRRRRPRADEHLDRRRR